MNFPTDDTARNLRNFLAGVPMPLPHYFEDETVQTRVGTIIGRLPPGYGNHVVWL